MTYKEYQSIQDRFTKKLSYSAGYLSNKETAYNEGILACKSILKEIYKTELHKCDGKDSANR